MDTSTEAVERNGLLSAIAKDAMSALRPLLEPVVLAKNSMLSTSGKVPEFCHFLEGGIASIIMTTSEGRSCEVGIVGREGQRQSLDCSRGKARRSMPSCKSRDMPCGPAQRISGPSC